LLTKMLLNFSLLFLSIFSLAFKSAVHYGA
jgi:hypothetical protein